MKQGELLLPRDWQAGMSRAYEGAVELRLVGTKWTAVRIGAEYIVCYEDKEMARVGNMTEATGFIETTRALEGL